jgi:hypothetical protein
MLTNLQTIFKSTESFFSNVESVGKPIEIGNVVLIPISTASFGTGGGGGGGGEQASNGFGFGLGASKSLIALVTGVGEVLVEALPTIFEMWQSQMGGQSPLSSEEKEKLMNI